MYDLWLVSGSHELPDFQDLVEHNPNLKDSVICGRMIKGFPRFLGLDLTEDMAKIVLERLKVAGARGMVVAVAYRQAPMTIEMAYPIAQRAVETEQQRLYPRCIFQPVRYIRDHAMWWTFLAASDELEAMGHSPGGVMISIDKVDGHVWQPEEFEALSQKIQADC